MYTCPCLSALLTMILWSDCGSGRKRERVEEREAWEGGWEGALRERDSDKGKPSKKRRKSSSGTVCTLHACPYELCLHMPCFFSKYTQFFGYCRTENFHNTNNIVKCLSMLCLWFDQKNFVAKHVVVTPGHVSAVQTWLCGLTHKRNVCMLGV